MFIPKFSYTKCQMICIGLNGISYHWNFRNISSLCCHCYRSLVLSPDTAYWNAIGWLSHRYFIKSNQKINEFEYFSNSLSIFLFDFLILFIPGGKSNCFIHPFTATVCVNQRSYQSPLIIWTCVSYTLILYSVDFIFRNVIKSAPRQNFETLKFSIASRV